MASYPQLNNSTGSISVTLKKAFTTTNYRVQATLAVDGGNSWHYNLVSQSVTKTSFTIVAASTLAISNTNGKITWLASGY